MAVLNMLTFFKDFIPAMMKVAKSLVSRYRVHISVLAPTQSDILKAQWVSVSPLNTYLPIYLPPYTPYYLPPPPLSLSLSLSLTFNRITGNSCSESAC